MLNPPYLVVRPALSFWVESRPPTDCSATLQAFEDRCFSHAWCYDAAGRAWRVVEARLKRPPTLVERVLPWRRVPVELRVEPRAEGGFAEALALIREILESDNDFREFLETPPAELLACVSGARNTADLIALLERHVGGA
jgi:hypothetical protein